MTLKKEEKASEYIMGEWENASNQHFLLFQHFLTYQFFTT